MLWGMNDTRIHLVLPSEDKAAIERAARERRTSVNAFVRELIVVELRRLGLIEDVK